MRLLASTLLVLLAVIYLHPGGVQAADTKDEVTEFITSVVGGIREEAAALAAQMLYRFNPIRMPVADEEQFLYDDDKPATNIIGSNNYCVDVKGNRYDDGNPIILWACGKAKRNQLWTFKSDGTLQSNGKCLTTSGYTAGNYIMIFDCDRAVPEATQWILSIFGSIMNPKSGLVISAENPTQRTVLTLANDNNSSRQAWKARNYTEPTIYYIKGLGGMCMQASTDRTLVWLATCATTPDQQWALYADSTFRLSNDRTLCVTSSGHSSLAKIILDKCQGVGDQRWNFMTDDTIQNLNARLVIDVKNGDVSLKELLLYQRTGEPSQKWWWYPA